MTPITSDSKPSALADDPGIGLALFLIFTIAILIVTGAVAMLALIDTWWVLGLAFGIHVLMTVAVGFAVFSALSAGSLTLTDGTDSRVAEAEEREPRPRTRIAGEAHPAAA
jgi:membrane protein implicated in regulation of membrane protease activity